MTILLYKDGRLVIDDGNPLEGRASLDGLVACVADPQSGDTLKFDGSQWVAGAAASGLPTVSGDDNGKVLTVVEGAWAPAAAGGGGGSDLFVMRVSNRTLDKTCAEIIAAVEAGKPCFIVDADGEQHYGETHQATINWYEDEGVFSSIDVSNGNFNYVGDALDGYPAEDMG